jgi:hypothetical protein
MRKAKQQPAPRQWWSPPFGSSPDPTVRRAFAEFTARKGSDSYSIGDVIAHLERRVPHTRAGSNDGSEITSSQLRQGLARYLRELRA